MNRSRYSFLVALVLSLAWGTARATGSVYSMFGIGDIAFSSNARSFGLGTVTAPLWSTSSIIPENPASWSAILRARLQGSFAYDRITTVGTDGSALFGTSGINGAALAVPLYVPMGVTLAMGFTPLSQVQYNFDFAPQLTPDSSASYSTQYQGTGGVSAFFIGSSVAPLPWLALGAALEYDFGAITKTSSAKFSGEFASTGYMNTTEYDRSSPDGFDGRFSAIAHVGDLSLGGIVRLPATLNTKYSVTIASSMTTVSDTTASVYYPQTLPLSYTLGVGYRLKEFLFAADYDAEDWNAMLINGVHPPEIRSSSKLGFGVERTGNPSITASTLDRWSFRIGGCYRQTCYSIVGTAINELFTTAGVGLPVGHDGYLDLGIQYGSRGTQSNGLLKENVFQLDMTFGMNEAWFVRTQE